MPRPRRHYLDDLSDDLFEWIQAEIEALVDAFKSGGRSPFAAQTTEAEKLAFYRRALFHPDGSPNEEGRAATLARIGIDGYVQVMKAVTRETRPGAPEPDEEEAV